MTLESMLGRIRVIFLLPYSTRDWNEAEIEKRQEAGSGVGVGGGEIQKMRNEK